MILLMEEIPNNHLGWLKPYKQWDKHHPWWCRISAINSMSPQKKASQGTERLVAKHGFESKPFTISLKYPGVFPQNSAALFFLGEVHLCYFAIYLTRYILYNIYIYHHRGHPQVMIKCSNNIYSNNWAIWALNTVEDSCCKRQMLRVKWTQRAPGKGR